MADHKRYMIPVPLLPTIDKVVVHGPIPESQSRKSPWGVRQGNYSRALQEAVGRPWICHDGVIDCLEGCPVGEPNTLAPSRLHREGIPAHVPTTMAIRAVEEMATPNGRRHK